MDEYIHKLNAKFKQELISYLDVLSTHEIQGFILKIKKTINVFSEPDLRSVKPHILIGGDELKINFSGTIIVQHQQDDGTTMKKVNFLSRNCLVIWDNKIEDFKVGPIDDFVPAGFAIR